MNEQEKNKDIFPSEKTIKEKLDFLRENKVKLVFPKIVHGANKIENVIFPSLGNEYKPSFTEEEYLKKEELSTTYRYPMYSENIVREHHELLVEEPFFSSLMHDMIRTDKGPVVGHKATKVPIKDEKGNFVLDEDGVPTFEIKDVKAITVATACVWFDPNATRYKCYYAPTFISHLTSLEKKSIIKHEMYHIIFKHLNMRDLAKDDGSIPEKELKKLRRLANICQDLAINSHLVDHLPVYLVLDGWLKDEAKDIEDQLSKEDIEAIMADKEVIDWAGQKPKNNEELFTKLALMSTGYMTPCIPGKDKFTFPLFKTSEWYWNELTKPKGKKGEDGEEEGEASPNYTLAGKGSGGSGIDVHIEQGDIDEDGSDVSGEKMEHQRICSKAQKKSNSDHWGSITADIQSDLDKYLSPEVNWKSQLEFFVRKTQVGGTFNTFHKVNTRYRDTETGAPFAPGPKRVVTSKVYVFIDESGSVDNNTLERFFSVLRDLSKYTQFILIPFDTEVKTEHKVVWEYNRPWKNVPRVACGGTSFQCVTDYCNKNAGTIEAAIIMTDFYADIPTISKVQRLWIGSEQDVNAAKSRNFTFRNNERVVGIKMDTNK